MRRINLTLNDKLKNIDDLQKFLLENPIEENFNKSIEKDFNLHYTHDSTAIEGNTLTLYETKAILEDGITIQGKSLREHFEVVNHAVAIDYIKSLVEKQEPLSENQIKTIHHFILRNIDDKNAGQYRQCNVKISGSKHIPPTYYNIQAEMDRFMLWYHSETQDLHPIIRASRVHIDVVGIHPFIDGNGRTSRLLMNLELMKSKFPAINIKSDYVNKTEYYEALEIAHCDNNCMFFDNLLANYMLERLQEMKHYIELDQNQNISDNTQKSQKEYYRINPRTGRREFVED